MDKLKVYRSDTYRQEFFDHVRPATKKRYFCIYCGKLLEPDDLQIDHILGIKYAKKHRRKAQLVARVKGFSDINDIKNLGASCQSCNGSKSSHGGMWIWRGYLGKHNAYQWVRWLLRFALVALIIGVLAYFWFAEPPAFDFFSTGT